MDINSLFHFENILFPYVVHVLMRTEKGMRISFTRHMYSNLWREYARYITLLNFYITKKYGQIRRKILFTLGTISVHFLYKSSQWLGNSLAVFWGSINQITATWAFVINYGKPQVFIPYVRNWNPKQHILKEKCVQDIVFTESYLAKILAQNEYVRHFNNALFCRTFSIRAKVRVKWCLSCCHLTRTHVF